MQKERYNDIIQFKEKLKRALRLSDLNISTEPSSASVTDAHIEMCWKIYQNSRNNEHGKLVCGLMSDLRGAKRQLGGTNKLHTGSVLDIVNKSQTPGGNWSTLANDCWILGGIHAHLPFQLVSNPTGATIKNPNYVSGKSNESHMMRVTARELIGLTRFGYKACSNFDIDSKSRELGVKYELRCFNTSKAREASIAGYLKVVRSQAQMMINHGAMPVRKYINNMMT